MLDGWLRSGKIFAKVAEATFPLWPSGAELEELARDGDARDELADSTVAVALAHFHQRSMIEGGWRPAGGRSLTIYFIGACLLEFPNEMKRFRRSRRTRVTEFPATEVIENLPAGRPGLDTSPLRDLLDGLDERTRRVLELKLDGYRHTEIAELTGMKVRAVEGVLYRWRQKHRREGGDSRG